MAHVEKKFTSKEIYHGKIFTVTADEVELENGNRALREVVHHSGGAAVVALNEKNEVALVRQFRYPHGRELLEIPAGKIEPGEPPLATAKRELREEAGCYAEILEDLGNIIPTCAYCTEVIYLYFARNLQPVSQNLDKDEFLDVFWLPFDKAVEMVLSGEINDSKTVAGLLKAKILIEKERL